MTKENTTEIVDSFKEAAPILRRPFTVDAVRWKVQTFWPKDEPTGALIVAYIDARLVVERLNMVCPHLWHDEYEPVKDGMLCSLTIDGITRRDVGTGYVGKGLYSDALKRAAVKFGVGVSLYSIPSMMLNSGPHLKVKGQAKKTVELTGAGTTACRGTYTSWLESVGKQTFGEVLDHGDTPDSIGDVEAYIDPADDGKPTDDQRNQVDRLFKALKMDEKDRGLLYAKHGIVQGEDATRDQVDGLIAELIGKSQTK